MNAPLPFSAAQFFDVFRAYNSVWGPVVPTLLALALAAVACTVWPRRRSDAFVSGVLAVLWLWSGLVYHLGFFAAINPAALVFAGMFIAGAISFAVSGVVRRQLIFRWRRDLRSALAGLLIAYALVAYPVGATMSGHPYPVLPTFGLPCPTTLFTIGILTLLQRPHPWSVLVAPLAWSLVGAQAAFRFGMWPDLALIPSAALAAALMFTARGRARNEKASAAASQAWHA
jgi:hypothetical protein